MNNPPPGNRNSSSISDLVISSTTLCLTMYVIQNVKDIFSILNLSKIMQKRVKVSFANKFQLHMILQWI